MPFTTFVPPKEWAAFHNSQYGTVIQYIEGLVHTPDGLDQQTLVSALDTMVEGIRWSAQQRTEREG